MTVYRYPPTPSLITVGDAFNSDSVDPDTLIVGAGAFLISTGGASAVALANTGAWTVRFDGLASGGTYGIALNGGNSQSSTIKIGGTASVTGGLAGVTLQSAASLVNAGTIAGLLGNSNGIFIFGTGTHTIVNTGTITTPPGGFGHYGIYAASVSKEVVTNSGIITSLSLGDGNDSVTNFRKVGHKVVSGHIDTTFLGAGDDSFKGGKFAETVYDSAGADHVSLGAGNDTGAQTTLNDGIDVFDGGSGVDTYSAANVAAELRINIDSVKHSVSAFGYVAVGASAVTGTTLGDQKDKITHFENARGTLESDLIYGTNGANKLEGLDDGDILCGFGGNDSIDGGAGEDHLFGGLGKDILTGGGAEGDRFQYSSIKDSGVTAATRDVITDFDGFDIINLEAIDANSTNAKGTNDTFNFIGTNVDFSGTAGELRAVWTAVSGQIVEADVNGDGKPDFSIELADISHGFDISGTFFP